jgi:hypothetical protein
MAALKGEPMCRHHSEREARTRAQVQADSIHVPPLSQLVAYDVTDGSALKRFRKGIMAHVARQTLGVQEARALLDVALTIYESERKDQPSSALSTLTSALRKAMKSEPPTPGEGGDLQSERESKDTKTRIATDPE